MNRAAVVELLHKQVVNVRFTKLNGEERLMSCTLQEDVLPQRKPAASDTQATTSEDDKPKTQQVVWDTKAEGFRTFIWDRVIDVNGQTVVVDYD